MERRVKPAEEPNAQGGTLLWRFRGVKTLILIVEKITEMRDYGKDFER